MEGKYIPIHPSNKQKHQNVNVSLLIRTETSSEIVEPAIAAVRKCAGPGMDDDLLAEALEVARLKPIDPSIIADMKVAKMSPNGIDP